MQILESAKKFIDSLPSKDQADILADLGAVKQSDFEIIKVKILKGKIKELIVRKYRILFFIRSGSVYVTNGFVKKSQKTPKREIDYAEKINKLIN